MKTGDAVSVIDDTLTGKIVKLKGDLATVEDEHGFTHEFSVDRLVLRDTELYDRPMKVPQKESPRVRSKKHNKEPLLLDLHFEKLVDAPQQYSAMERLFIQRERLVETLEFCRENRIKRLRVIHGIGDGVLQSLVREILSGYADIEFEDDDFFRDQSGWMTVFFR